MIVIALLAADGSAFQPSGRRGLNKVAGNLLTQDRHRRYMSGSNNGDESKNQKDRKDDDDDSYTWAEIQADEELRKLEFDASMKRKNSILLPQRISRAVTTFGWLFVISGFVLNQTGYAWVRDPAGGLRIGTLDERNFQREVLKERRTGGEVGEHAPVSMSAAEFETKHLVSWIEQHRESRSV